MPPCQLEAPYFLVWTILD